MNAISFEPSRKTIEKAKIGSRQLRDAIFRFQGLELPEEPKPVRLCPTCSTPFAPRRQMIADIQQVVGAFFGFSRNSLISDRREKELVRARQLAMYLATELTNHSISEIGRRFNRDHTTVLYALKVIRALAESDEEVAFNIMLLRERLSV